MELTSFVRSLNHLRRRIIPAGLSAAELRKHICRLTIIWTFAFIAVIRAGFHYRDDVGRAAEGYYRWSEASRYLSDLFTFILNCGKSAWDLSPMTQILAIFLTAAAGSILMELFKGDKRQPLLGYASVTLMGLNPFWLSCLSFQYDSPFMALSVLGSVFPVLFWDNDAVVFSGMAIAGTLIMCTTYQASSGLFPMLIVFYAFFRWSRKEEPVPDIAKKAIIAAASYVFAMIFYRTVLIRKVPDYASASMVPFTSLFRQIQQGYLEYYTTIRREWSLRWQILAALIIGMFVLTQMLDSRRNKAATLGLTILSAVISSFLAYGVYLVLEVQVFTPRVMYGFGILLAVMALCICSSAGFLSLPGKAAVLLLGWCFISFTFLYGNSLGEQKAFTEARLQPLVEDLNELEQLREDKVVSIQFTGTRVLSPVVQNRMKDYPILYRLIPPTMGRYMWAQYYMTHYLGFTNLRLERGRKLKKMKLPLIKETVFYSIYGNEDYLRVEMADK